jgi:nucleotide-binding universal stress UspA family protein
MESGKGTLETANASRAQGSSSGDGPPASGPLRLLVGYDGGTGSRDALSFARALCEKTEVELTVASVRPYRPGPLGAEGFAIAIKEDEHWIAREACAVLGSIPFSARAIGGGHEAAGLKELAEAEGIDMIVVGSTHRGRIGSVFPGSVGGRVLDGAPCGVAITPRGLADRDFSIQTIAVGYDGSRASVTALKLAVGLAERTDASLLILGAVEISIGIAGFETRQSPGFQQAQMERHLQRALESVPSTVPAESRLLFGEPAEMIVEAANEVDLLILGSQGSYGLIPRLMLGSVGAAVVRGAPRATLITPTDS